jgi:aryl-alcohol dehydrogenase-like predicted oxidoreductase
MSMAWAASRFLTPDRVDAAAALKRFAESRGHSLLELAMAWLARLPVVASIIAGATSPAQVQANALAVEYHLTDADLAVVDSIVPAPVAPRPA